MMIQKQKIFKISLRKTNHSWIILRGIRWWWTTMVILWIWFSLTGLRQWQCHTHCTSRGGRRRRSSCCCCWHLLLMPWAAAWWSPFGTLAAAATSEDDDDDGDGDDDVDDDEDGLVACNCSPWSALIVTAKGIQNSWYLQAEREIQLSTPQCNDLPCGHEKSRNEKTLQAQGGPGFAKMHSSRSSRKPQQKIVRTLFCNLQQISASSKLGRAASAKLQVSLQVYTFWWHDRWQVLHAETADFRWCEENPTLVWLQEPDPH